MNERRTLCQDSSVDNVAAKISAAFADLNQEDPDAEIRERFNAAKAIVSTIPSGTRDVDLTPEQAAALDEYDRCLLALREMA